MPSQEEQTRILQMVADGKLTPEEAAEMLALLGQADTAEAPQPTTSLKGRWLRVRVYDADGKPTVNINLPLRLVEVGLGIARRFLPAAQADELADSLQTALSQGLTGPIIDVVDHEDGERVTIAVE